MKIGENAIMETGQCVGKWDGGVRMFWGMLYICMLGNVVVCP